MKTFNFFSLTILAGIMFVSCEPETTTTSQNLADTAWKLVELQNSETSETEEYPSQENSYIIEFNGNNDVAFPNHCNISAGKYFTDENGNISFSDFYPSTKVYCGSLSYWEDTVCQNLFYSQTYKVSADKLTIICGTTTLIFRKVVLQENNILSNTEWKIANYHFLGQYPNTENYALTLHGESENIGDNWGTFVRFTDEGTFISFDRQPCGNSCFTAVYGRYSVQDNSTLILLVDSVNVDCTGADGTNETEIRNGEEIRFEILNYSPAAFQLQKEGTVPNSNIIGQWCSSDRTIVFTEDMHIFEYFPQYLSTDNYFTYSLLSDSITVTFHQQDNSFNERFKYILDGEELTIYGFSNPFSVTNEVRTDVVFARCELTTFVE
jgi:heat shock protein HslJ